MFKTPLIPLSVSILLGLATTANAMNEGGNDGLMDEAAANNGMDIPVFTGISFENNILSVRGYVGIAAQKIASPTANGHRIEVFRVGDNADPSGFGEVEEFINECQTEADGTFECDLDTSGLPQALVIGDVISATATYDPTATDGHQNSSSEYAFNEEVRDCLEVGNTFDIGPGSLRAAIDCANANAPVPEVITFNIPTTDPGYDAAGGFWQIKPASPMYVSDELHIDARTQPGYVATAPFHPVINLDGADLPVTTSSTMLTLNAANSVLEGVSVTGVAEGTHSSDGTLRASAPATFIGNYLGVMPDGITQSDIGSHGIWCPSTACIIGGPNASDRNYLNNAGQAAISINGANSTGTIENNVIGVDVTGNTEAGSVYGIELWQTASNVLIKNNVISGNTTGITQAGGVADNIIITGNKFGTNVAGTAAVGNTGRAINLNGGTNITIGGTNGTTPGGACTGDCNLISGNGADGIYVTGATAGIDILGNLVGTDISGTAEIANGQHGIQITQAGVVTIGDGTSEGRNTVSGNSVMGIFLNNTAGSVINHNYVGLNTAGTAAVPNGRNGVDSDRDDGIYLASPGTTGSVVSYNVVSGNARNGISIVGATNSALTGNIIGLNATADAKIGNGTNGLALVNMPNTLAEPTLIGDTSDAGRNIISGNGDNGLIIVNAENVVADNNLIGVMADANTEAANGNDGVYFRGASTDVQVANNIIAMNADRGIELEPGVDGATIRKNQMFGNGHLGIDLVGDGVDNTGAAE